MNIMENQQQSDDVFKVIVAGCRNYTYIKGMPEVRHHLNEILKLKAPNIEIVSGKCKGADAMGESYAHEKGYRVKEFPADWSLGKKAGYERNKKMAEYANALVAFWDGKSAGTKLMIDLAKANNLQVRVINILTQNG